MVRYLGSVRVEIADPRIPTASLEFTASSGIYRTVQGNAAAAATDAEAAGVELNVTTMTYTGAAIANAAVTVRWQVQRQTPFVPYPMPGPMYYGEYDMIGYGRGGGGGGYLSSNTRGSSSGSLVTGVSAFVPRPWPDREPEPPAAAGEFTLRYIYSIYP